MLFGKFIVFAAKQQKGITVQMRPNYYFSSQSYYDNIPQSKHLKSAAVLLSGSGVYDGSEITEAVSLIIQLSLRGVQPTCFSLKKNQFHVINHQTGEVQQQQRDVLEESARIARGNVKDLKELNINEFDALFIPGGFGVAKNLSNFATEGPNMNVDENVEKVIREFYNHKKPIGAMCISGIVLARIFGTKFGGPGLTLTLGDNHQEKNPYRDSIGVAEGFGNQLNLNSVLRPCVDSKHLVASAPAYMEHTASPGEVFRGIGNLVDEVDKLCNLSKQ